ncbi:hypothetical protein QQF64_011704 [Cirrhinus molitorella]|uniref:MHC class I antigen n=1 Tax=Cirrhinus molitorella TaxID=172907 RepID=A0ABR3M1L9_9TELE
MFDFPPQSMGKFGGTHRLSVSVLRAGRIMTEVAGYPFNFDLDESAQSFFGVSRETSRAGLSKYTSPEDERRWAAARAAGRERRQHRLHLGTANWQLISRIDSVVGSQVPPSLDLMSLIAPESRYAFGILHLADGRRSFRPNQKDPRHTLRKNAFLRSS